MLHAIRLFVVQSIFLWRFEIIIVEVVERQALLWRSTTSIALRGRKSDGNLLTLIVSIGKNVD
jgi:hypothetical protein